MAYEATIEYRAFDWPWPDDRQQSVLFGAYRIAYADDFNVLLPHAGHVGTVSQEPLDIDDAEVRGHLLAIAAQIRAAHGLTG